MRRFDWVNTVALVAAVGTHFAAAMYFSQPAARRSSRI